MEIWTSGVSSPRGIIRVARDIEAAGWDGLVVVDSQNLSGDPYVALAMAATVTDRIGLGPGVTNSVTRAAAVTATSIASVQRIAEGRAVMGIGRGDSALAHLGRSPGRVVQFERYLRHLQLYLKGESVPFDEIVDIPAAVAPPMSELELADAPPDSKIEWMAGTDKVPVEVAASGPRVIEVGARHADRLMFTLGADTDRIAWGIDHARQARKEAGLDPDGMAFGAYINAACHSDMDTARDLVRGGLTTFARFSVMHGKASGPLTESNRGVLQDLRNSYDMKKHTQGDSRQAGVLTPDFIDRFAIVGSPEQCIERLQSLAALGLDKVIISGGRRGADQVAAKEAQGLMEREVLPAF